MQPQRIVDTIVYVILERSEDLRNHPAWYIEAKHLFHLWRVKNSSDYSGWRLRFFIMIQSIS